MASFVEQRLAATTIGRSERFLHPRGGEINQTSIRFAGWLRRDHRALYEQAFAVQVTKSFGPQMSAAARSDCERGVAGKRVTDFSLPSRCHRYISVWTSNCCCYRSIRLSSSEKPGHFRQDWMEGCRGY